MSTVRTGTGIPNVVPTKTTQSFGSAITSF
jgi:hypothetical protein